MKVHQLECWLKLALSDVLQVLKSIAGQSAFQLAAMYALVFHGPAIFGVASSAMVDGPSEHYTLVFNAFVLMQLFNQVHT